MSLAQGIRISCANYLPIGVESINSNLAVISPEKVAIAGSRKVFSSAGTNISRAELFCCASGYCCICLNTR